MPPSKSPSKQRQILKQLANGIEISTTEVATDSETDQPPASTKRPAEEEAPLTTPPKPKRKKLILRQKEPDPPSSPIPSDDSGRSCYTPPAAPPPSLPSPTADALKQRKKCIQDLMELLDDINNEKYQIYKLRSKIQSSDSNDAFELQTPKSLRKANQRLAGTRAEVHKTLDRELDGIKAEKERWMNVYDNEIQIVQANLDEWRSKRSDVMELGRVLVEFEHGGFLGGDDVLEYIAACRPFPLMSAGERSHT